MVNTSISAFYSPETKSERAPIWARDSLSNSLRTNVKANLSVRIKVAPTSRMGTLSWQTADTRWRGIVGRGVIASVSY